MITYKCNNCGGEMSISASGSLTCSYCGNKSNFSDSELKNYREFRTTMLTYLKALADNKADEKATGTLWGYSETALYETSDGEDVNIQYLFRANDDGVNMFMCKDSVIYIFEGEHKAKAARMLSAIKRVEFPGADVKNLDRCIPKLKAELELSDGILLAFEREENMYPLGAFGSLDYKHAAWIMSRLENICCILEYSELLHNGINLESVYINPFMHEAALYGGWWNTVTKPLNSVDDLVAIRKVCDRVMGVNQYEVPNAFKAFLKNKPGRDAYEDFGIWDNVIEHGLGGRHFHKMNINTLNKEI